MRRKRRQVGGAGSKLGESGYDMSIATLFVILYWAWVASEILLQVVTRTRRRSGEVKDRGSLLLLLTVIFGSIWAATSYRDAHAPTMLGRAHWLGTAALVLLIAGLAIRWTAIITLGRSFSTNVAIHATQTVHKTGLFRWVRHPSYTGMLLIFTAIGVSQRNWVSLAIMLTFPTAALIYRIAVEEKALTEAFGEHYVEYSRVTKRLVPRIY
jgi:protein-S-isoprenylcysteine O-methyltransferase Ste14